MAQQPGDGAGGDSLAAEAVVRRFEQAWADGQRPVLHEYLPAAPELRQRVLPELVQADLEFRLKAGEPARVEAYLTRYVELAEDRPTVLRLIAAEYDLRCRRQSPPAWDEYLTRFPEYRTDLISVSPPGPPPPEEAPALCPFCQCTIDLRAVPHGADMVCPVCGSTITLEKAPLAAAATRCTRLGKFRLLEVVGRGSFGVVYRARDTELDRLVALKVPRQGTLMTAEDVDRFLREARSASQLQHPGIVAVHDAGQIDETCYLVSEFVEGKTLADQLTSRRFTPREAARLLADVADALHYAHSRGVVHRDVKPSNIMLRKDEGGRMKDEKVSDPVHPSSFGLHPFLMDFGLAKRDAGEVTMTLEGQLLGTPAYMSPEQARGEAHTVDGRSDVYSAGVILYQLLTGELPFRGNVSRQLHQVLHDEPRTPHSLNDKVPRDLEIICLKAMAKEPGRRYQTAGDLASDLRRFLADEPILARPTGAWDRSRKWARRRPALAAALAILAVAGLGLLVGGLWYQIQLRGALQTAENRRLEADTNLYHSLVREARALRLARVNGYRVQAWSRLQEALRLDTLEKDRDELRQEAVACLGDFVGLEPTTWTDFPAHLRSLAVAPRGEWLALGLEDGTLLLRDLKSGTERARWRPHQSRINALAFGPDGQVLVSAERDGTIKVWQPSAAGPWTCARTITTDAGLVSVALTLDGKYLAAGLWDGTRVPVWRLADGTPADDFDGQGYQLGAVAVSPDGRHVAARSYQKGAHGVLVWERATRQLRRTLLSPVGEVNHLVFSPDSRLLACACEEGMVLFETAEYHVRFFVRGDVSDTAAFSPDGRLLAFASFQIGVVRLWNVGANREVAALTQPDPVRGPRSVAFSPDGPALISAAAQSVRLWSLAGSGEKLLLSGHASGVTGVAFSPDGRLLASASQDRTVKLWDPATGQVRHTLTGFQAHPQALAFSPDGQWLATADWAGTVRVWDVQTGPRPREASTHDPEVGPWIWSIAFSPDGRTFAACGRGLTIWRVEAGPAKQGVPSGLTLERLVCLPEPSVTTLCFSPAGDLLAWADLDRTLHLWDLAHARTHPAPPSRLAGSIYSLAFFPDGQHLTFINTSGEAEVWNVLRGQRVSAFPGEGAGRSAQGVIALSADGKWLAAQSTRSLAVTVWDTERKDLLVALPEERGTIWTLAWRPDRQSLAVGLSDGGLVLWDFPTIQAQLADLGLGW